MVTTWNVTRMGQVWKLVSCEQATPRGGDTTGRNVKDRGGRSQWR